MKHLLSTWNEHRRRSFGPLCFLLLLCTLNVAHAQKSSRLKGKVICLDPGHGGTAKTDAYRQGPAGEREEWINLRVARILQELLVQKGAKVLMTRTEDVFVPIPDRAKMAVENHADLFLSIHHNATADSAVNFPIIYFHGHVSENKASVALGRTIAKALRTQFYGGKTPLSLVSDYTIFAERGAGVLRGTYGIPAVLSEASFFTNPTEESRLKDTTHNREEAMAYVAALESFFDEPQPPIVPKNSLVSVLPFRGLQEAARMSGEAKTWYADYKAGLRLMQRGDTASIRGAYDLFTRSDRSFPDSYVARECHQNRAFLLERQGKSAAAAEERKRAKEFYVVLD
ncbi:N-acetylmuramoyl-L-alanine amidase [Olivibacter sp. XZL3]|uniref:N-acetylmuramoyl-L-alanine amidase family protein n=1 Tax=Olivibacter sp. XZL3 TaxID=1735116 RepID=UPI00106593B9|nr:N-acetylmuramoyl-L-alanine amidase [Olivibacter sp. XZL3]